MSQNPPEPIIREAPHSEEVLYIPTRRVVHIQDGDWERWLLSIASIPSHDSLFRDIAFTSIGVAIPSILTFITQGFSTQWAPSWPLFVYLAVGVAAVVAGGACLIFDKRMDKVIHTSANHVLEDMQAVRQRAAVSEEQVRPSQSLSIIG